MKYLVVVDMQNDFITGSLGTKEAQAIVPKVAEKITKFLEERKIHGRDSREVFFTQDTHFPNYLNTLEGKYLPIPHCIKHTPGWCICDEVFPYTDMGCITEKNSFGLPSWYNKIRATEGDTIEICGLCTDICVISNALQLKTENPDVRIIVDASCCAGTTPEMHKKALDVMKSCQIEVINGEDK